MPHWWLRKGSLLINTSMMSSTPTHSPRFHSMTPAPSLEEGELPRSPAALYFYDDPHFDFTSPRSWSTTPQDHALANSSFHQHLEELITQPTLSPILSPSSFRTTQDAPHATPHISIGPLPSVISAGSTQQEIGATLQQPLATKASTIAKAQPAHDDEDRYASDSDSDSPLESGQARRRTKVRSSSTPDPLLFFDSEPEPSLHGSALESKTKGTRDDVNPSPSRSSKLLARRFGEEAKYQIDVDWLDECDCCKQHGKRCYTSAGSLLRSTSCYNCYIRHWTCTVDSIRVNRKPPQAPRKRKSDVTTDAQTSSAIQPSSDSYSHALRQQEQWAKTRAPTSTSQRRTSGRVVRPPQHAPVLATPLPLHPKPTGKRRKRIGPKKSGVEQARTTRSQSELSSPPPSDQEHLSNVIAFNNTLVSEAQPEAFCSSAGVPCSSAVQAQETTADESGDEMENNTVESSSAAETHTSSSISLTKRRVNTLLLINDIAVAIQRCQRRLTQAPDHAGLLVIESAVDELVVELTRVVGPDHTAVVDSKMTTWTVTQLLDYLHRILGKCQYARGTENLDERGARQVAALVTCETLFDRCMSVISSMKVEKS